MSRINCDICQSHNTACELCGFCVVCTIELKEKECVDIDCESHDERNYQDREKVEI